MKNILTKSISAVLTVVMVLSICNFGAIQVEAARASEITLGGVTLSRDPKVDTCTKKLDSGDIIEHNFTYYDYTAQLNSPSITGATDYFENMKQTHPRLLIDDFGNLLDKIDYDYVCALNYKGLKEQADKILDTEPYAFYLNQRDNINDFSGNIETRVTVLSFVYNIEREKTELGRADATTDYVKYAERAVEELLAAADYPHWSVNAFLCTAEIADAFAIGYDWLYYYLSKSANIEAKEKIEAAVYNQAIVPFLYNYIVDKTGTDFAYTGMNWNPVCNGSAIIIGMAFYNSADTTGKYSTICQYLTERGAEALWNGMGQYEDGGFYREGASYWSYATHYLVRAVAAYEFAANPGYVLPERYTHILAPGVSETPNFPIYMNGITATFDFGDCSSGLQLDPSIIWIGNRFNKPEYGSYYNNMKQLYNKAYEGKDAVSTILWYQPGTGSFDVLEELPRDLAHVSENDVNILSLRSDFEINTTYKPSAFVAMQGGKNLANHMGTHLGTFVLDMNGKRFVKQLPNGNYAWEGYNSTNAKYKWYVRRAEGNNTMVFDPQDAAKTHDQASTAFAKIIKSGTSENVGYGIMDLTSTNPKLAKWYRGIMIADDRQRVIVQDEIEAADQISDAYWFAHIGTATYELGTDGKSVVLTTGGQSVRASITSGNGVFEVVDAKPLETSPNPTDQQSKDYGKKLRIHLTNVTKQTLCVEFAPADKTEVFKVTKLSEWDDLLSDGNVQQVSNYLNTNNYTLDWYDASYTTYYIHNDKDLAGLAYLVNQGTDFAGKTVKIANDITLDTTLQWVPIGTVQTPFKGTFDGSQKKITGARYNDSKASFVGLFGITETATIKNLELSDFDFNTKGDTGALVAQANDTTIYNVFVDGATLRAQKRLGGIVGVQYGGTIINSGVNAKVFGLSTMYGGIAGYATGVVDNCSANTQLCEEEGVIVGSNRGGIVGISACADVKNSYYNYVVKYCGSGTQPMDKKTSVNLSNTLGKYDHRLVVTNIGGTNSVLGYVGDSTYLDKVNNAWITANNDEEIYLTWVATEGEIGKYSKLAFVPETVTDTNDGIKVFAIQNPLVTNGQLSFDVKNNRVYNENSGCLIVNQKSQTASSIKMVWLDMDANAKQTITVDAVSDATVQIFVLDSFITMKIKSNILKI